MKILQLNMEAGWRGGERQTLLCMHEFRQAGHEVVLVARRNGPLALRARQDGFRVSECRGPLTLAVFLLMHGRHFDILHAQTANTLTWLALAKRLLRRPLVFTRRTAFRVSAKRQRKTFWKWRQVDLLVAISDAAAQEPYRAGLAVEIIPSAVAAQPVSTQRVQEMSGQYHLSGKKVVATVAALTREKDPETLIQAIHALAQRRSDIVCLHIGSDGDVAQAAKALVKKLQLEHCYIFTGFHDNIADFYRLMDVFVLSSVQEALGSSVLDAFLYRVPVAATRAGGLSELLGQGRGLLCDPGNAQELSLAIERLLDDAALRQSVVASAYTYVETHHAVQAMGRRYLEAYQQLIRQ